MHINDSASLREIEPQDRVLLLPHCLRLSKRCNARYDRAKGLVCEGCTADCPINQLKTAAEERGLGGVCIAPGGSLAVRYIEEHQPQGVVAVACDKELEMGIQAVASSGTGSNGNGLVVMAIPLSRDGCVDTQVNLEAVVTAINL